MDHTLPLYIDISKLPLIGTRGRVQKENHRQFVKDIHLHQLHFNSKIFHYQWVWWDITRKIGFRIFEIYNAGLSLKISQNCIWSRQDGLCFDQDVPSQIWLRRTMEGMQIRAGSVSNPPQQIKRRLSNGQIAWGGIFPEIFEAVKNIMKFK